MHHSGKNNVKLYERNQRTRYPIHLGKHICIFWKKICFCSINRLSYLVTILKNHGKKSFFGLPFRHYQLRLNAAMGRYLLNFCVNKILVLQNVFALNENKSAQHQVFNLSVEILTGGNFYRNHYSLSEDIFFI